MLRPQGDQLQLREHHLPKGHVQTVSSTVVVGVPVGGGARSQGITDRDDKQISLLPLTSGQFTFGWLAMVTGSRLSSPNDLRQGSRLDWLVILDFAFDEI